MLLLSLGSVEIEGISLGRILAVLAVLLCARYGGVAGGSVSGAAAALNHVISQDAPGQSEVASAMAALTQAMAGVY